MPPRDVPRALSGLPEGLGAKRIDSSVRGTHVSHRQIVARELPVLSSLIRFIISVTQ